MGTPRRGALSSRALHAPLWMVVLTGLLLVAVLVAAFALAMLLATGKAESPKVAQLRSKTNASAADPAVKTQLAYVLQQEGRYDEALDVYDSALQADPKNLAALYNRGLCLLAMNRNDEAEASLKRVLALAPAHVLAANALGEYYLKGKQYDALIAVVKPAADKNPTVSDLHYLLARGLEGRGEGSGALKEYRQALKTNPRLKGASQGVGRLSNDE